MAGSSIPYPEALSSGPGALGERPAEAPAGDRPAEQAARPLDLRALFDAHHAQVWGLLRRLGVMPSQLDDAVQEVFWVAARKLGSIEPGRERSFLYGVALRVASSERRRRRAGPDLAELDQLASLSDHGPSPEQALEERRARELLDVVLDQLPAELRSVLVLHELEGLEVKEIAVLEEVPLGTASSRLRRAREEFSAAARRVKARLSSQRGAP